MREGICSVIDRIYAQDLELAKRRLSSLKVQRGIRRFVVARMGSTGSTWLAKLLNSDPDVFCSHEGVIAQVYPSRELTHEDVLKYVEYFAWDTKHGAYSAVGDVGSMWVGHFQHLQGFAKAILVRHPARLLQTRLVVYPGDRSFSSIRPEVRSCLQEIWGIDLEEYEAIDRIFLHDIFVFASQICAVRHTDIVIRIEDLKDTAYCLDVLKTLTGVEYDAGAVERAVRKPVNRRSGAPSRVSEIVSKFTPRQQDWYRRMLRDVVEDFGYELHEGAE